MVEFRAKSANHIWEKIRKKLVDPKQLNLQNSRNGKTYEFLHSWISLSNPRQRWMTIRNPGINPAFAIAEVVWIITGRNDSKFLNYWNSQLCKYSGNSNIYHGAYGFRLRKSLGIDQLKTGYRALKKNESSRQVVLQIWNSQLDLPTQNGKSKDVDIPCNILSLLKIREKKLEWVQILRSNDIFRGLPYNIIQFTTLQEIVAGWLEIEVGTYSHFSDSLHLYLKDYENIKNVFKGKNIVNNDSLSLPYNLSMKLFKQFENKLDLISTGSLKANRIWEIGRWNNAPQGFKNLLYIVLAEEARKKKELSLSVDLIANCTNPALIITWTNWSQRFQRN